MRAFVAGTANSFSAVAGKLDWLQMPEDVGPRPVAMRLTRQRPPAGSLY